VFNLELREVSYTNLSNTTVVLNRTFPGDPNGAFDLPSGAMGNQKFFFPDITAKSISLTFRQSNYNVVGTQREFIFGLRSISLEKLDITADTGTFLFTYKLPAGKTFSLVNVPTAIDYNLSDMLDDGLIKYDLFIGHSPQADTSIPFAFNSRIRSAVESITVRVSLTRKGAVIPYLCGIKLDFEVK